MKKAYIVPAARYHKVFINTNMCETTGNVGNPDEEYDGGLTKEFNDNIWEEM